MPKRLVFVIRSAQVGGVEQHVIDLIQSLRGRYSIDLVSLTDEPAHQSFAQLGIPLHQLKGRTVQGLGSLSNLGDLRRKFKELSPDIVHLHGIRPIFFGSIAARIARVPKIVSTFHSSHRLMAMNEAGAVQPLKLLASKVMHFLGIACSTHAIAVSRQLDQELKRILRQALLLPYWINRHKLRVIYNGIELERFWRHSLPLREVSRDVTVGFVGRLDPKKGIEDLIEAVTELIHRGNRLRLLIVGTGWYREKLEPIVARAGMSDRICFLGHRSDVMTLAQEFDIFALPSLSEGLPISIIEMMAIGLPIVATKVGGIPEQVGDGFNGLLIAPRDTAALAKAIERLYAEPSLRLTFARNGQARAKAMFDSRMMLEATEAVYST